MITEKCILSGQKVIEMLSSPVSTTTQSSNHSKIVEFHNEISIACNVSNVNDCVLLRKRVGDRSWLWLVMDSYINMLGYYKPQTSNSQMATTRIIQQTATNKQHSVTMLSHIKQSNILHRLVLCCSNYQPIDEYNTECDTIRIDHLHCLHKTKQTSVSIQTCRNGWSMLVIIK
jgi:hypothetical protein